MNNTMLRRIATTAAVLATALALAACGSDNDSGPSDAQVEDAATTATAPATTTRAAEAETKTEETTQEAAADGKAIFTEAGCNACHTLSDAGATASVGPDLDELAANAPRRRPGGDAAAYVEESIVDPRAFVVPDFPGNVMPTDYGDQLSPEEIDALVEYLLGASR